MKLDLKRQKLTPAFTIGSLYIDGKFQCFTLEDPVRETDEPVEKWKIKDNTAIPRGTYKVTITRSQKFNKITPLLHFVPGFEGIRIHSGNTIEDTEGCILVGDTYVGGTILSSRKAFDKLMSVLKGDITITIS